MMFIKLASIILFMISFVAYPKEISKYRGEYIKCLSTNVDNPMSTTCIDSEVNAQNQLIISLVNKHQDIISPEDGNSIDLKLFVKNQRKSIDEKCKLWLKAGGQNGVLLSKQCILDESMSLKNMLEEFVNVIDG